MPENGFDKELLVSNLLGANTLQALYEKEKILTNTKMIMLKENPVEGKFDYAHLKAIHYFLFSEVYSWAGQDRYDAHIVAKFGKGKTVFTSYAKLPDVSKVLFDALEAEAYFKGQEKEEFTLSMSIFMNGLNILHPFREGNGRVQRIFMQYLAENAGYTLNFQDILEDEMTKASIAGASGDLALVRNIFTKTISV